MTHAAGENWCRPRQNRRPRFAQAWVRGAQGLSVVFGLSACDPEPKLVGRATGMGGEEGPFDGESGEPLTTDEPTATDVGGTTSASGDGSVSTSSDPGTTTGPGSTEEDAGPTSEESPNETDVTEASENEDAADESEAADTQATETQSSGTESTDSESTDTEDTETGSDCWDPCSMDNEGHACCAQEDVEGDICGAEGICVRYDDCKATFCCRPGYDGDDYCIQNYGDDSRCEVIGNSGECSHREVVCADWKTEEDCRADGECMPMIARAIVESGPETPDCIIDKDTFFECVDSQLCADAEAYGCDMDGNVWWSQDTCLPSMLMTCPEPMSHEHCDAR